MEEYNPKSQKPQLILFWNFLGVYLFTYLRKVKQDFLKNYLHKIILEVNFIIKLSSFANFINKKQRFK